MKLEQILFGMILLLSFSCVNQSEPKSKVEEEPVQSELQDSILIEAKADFPPPINIYELNQLENLDYTSGGGPADASYCPSDTIGFYGSYNLIDHSAIHSKGEVPLFGRIIIYSPSADMSNWTAEDSTQQLREITVSGSLIKLWDSIAVGIREEDLEQFLEPHFHYKKGTELYAELGIYKASFRIEQGRVTEIYVRIKCAEN